MRSKEKGKSGTGGEGLTGRVVLADGMGQSGQAQDKPMVQSRPNIRDGLIRRRLDPPGDPGLACRKAPVRRVDLDGKLPVDGLKPTSLMKWTIQKGPWGRARPLGAA